MWRAAKETVVKNRCLDSVEEGESGMIWESSIETHTFTVCKTDNQREFDVRHRAPKPVLCANLEGWIGGGEGGGSGGRGHKYAAEAIILQLK